MYHDILMLIWSIVNVAMGVGHYKLTERNGSTKTSYFILTLGITISAILLVYGLDYDGNVPKLIQPLCS